MKKLRQQYDEQVLAGGPLRDWLDDHSAMQCAEAATPVEVKADVAEDGIWIEYSETCRSGMIKVSNAEKEFCLNKFEESSLIK